MLVEILEGTKKSRILIATFYMHSDNRIPSEPTGTRIHMLSGKPDLLDLTLGANVPFRNPKNHITIKIFGLEKIKRYMGYRDFYMEDRRYSK